MKERMKHLLPLLLLVLALLLTGCNQEIPEETTAPTQATTEPTVAVDYYTLYTQAAESITQHQVLVLDLRYSETRTVGGVSYPKAGVGTAIYSNIGTDSMDALIVEDLTFGSFQATYTQSYLNGMAYTQTSGTSFASQMAPGDFLSYQIPAVLLDSSLYSSITWEPTGGNRIAYRFSDATGFEAWAKISPDAQLVEASGQAIIDETGTLRESSYRLSYTLGNIPCQLEVKVILSFADMGTASQHPTYPETCVQLDAYLAPRLILQTVGAVYHTENITGTQTETIYCEAATLARTQQTQVDAFGSDKDFMAQVGYTVSLANYAGTPTINTKVETFRDGKCFSAVNGGEPKAEQGITAKRMREYCEDLLLSCLLTPELITGAKAVDTGEFYVIQFTCQDTLSDTVLADTIKLLGLDLDNFAQSYTTETGTAYLSISKTTGLPVTLGRSFTRIHVIDGVSYRTTHQTDSSIFLPSDTAYSTITGQVSQETEPETKATPLFYKVTDKKGRTLWLLGTIHVGDNRTGFLPQEIYDAFLASDHLAVEFDTIAFQQQAASDPLLKSQLAAAYYYADGSLTAQHLDAQLYEKAYALILASGGNSMEIPKMKPILWESMLESFYLSQDATLSSQYGMDTRLLLLAREHGKSIRNIETGLSQVQMLTGFSEGLQAMLLRQAADTSLAAYCQAICQLYEAWCQGDEAAILAAISEDTSNMTEEELALHNEYNKAVVTNRNATMLKAAKDYIKSGKTTFFAVGLTHLLGEDGLVAKLQSAGYTVQQVTYDSLAAQPAA